SRVPFWLYTDEEIYQRELERLFYGPHWSYVGLSCEIPNAGDFKRTWIGERNVLMVRDENGAVNVIENRCAHRGVQFCREATGNRKEFVCPYHQWNYDLKGNLLGVPYMRGIKGKGGMPADFKRDEHGLRKLGVTERNGVVFASFDPEVEDFETFLGPTMLKYFDRVF
ncbi:MAG TPA: salicylate hydroxylase, partial [Pusillimonas sp.]|nr:salicylate hydroxylase [Pusillimonas sp.]